MIGPGVGKQMSLIEKLSSLNFPLYTASPRSRVVQTTVPCQALCSLPAADLILMVPKDSPDKIHVFQHKKAGDTVTHGGEMVPALLTTLPLVHRGSECVSLKVTVSSPSSGSSRILVAAVCKEGLVEVWDVTRQACVAFFLHERPVLLASSISSTLTGGNPKASVDRPLQLEFVTLQVTSNAQKSDTEESQREEKRSPIGVVSCWPSTGSVCVWSVSAGMRDGATSQEESKQTLAVEYSSLETFLKEADMRGDRKDILLMSLSPNIVGLLTSAMLALFEPMSNDVATIELERSSNSKVVQYAAGITLRTEEAYMAAITAGGMVDIIDLSSGTVELSFSALGAMEQEVQLEGCQQHAIEPQAINKEEEEKEKEIKEKEEKRCEKKKGTDDTYELVEGTNHGEKGALYPSRTRGGSEGDAVLSILSLEGGVLAVMNRREVSLWRVVTEKKRPEDASERFPASYYEQCSSSAALYLSPLPAVTVFQQVESSGGDVGSAGGHEDQVTRCDTKINDGGDPSRSESAGQPSSTPYLHADGSSAHIPPPECICSVLASPSTRFSSSSPHSPSLAAMEVLDETSGIILIAGSFGVHSLHFSIASNAMVEVLTHFYAQVDTLRRKTRNSVSQEQLEEISDRVQATEKRMQDVVKLLGEVMDNVSASSRSTSLGLKRVDLLEQVNTRLTQTVIQQSEQIATMNKQLEAAQRLAIESCKKAQENQARVEELTVALASGKWNVAPSLPLHREASVIQAWVKGYLVRRSAAHNVQAMLMGQRKAWLKRNMPKKMEDLLLSGQAHTLVELTTAYNAQRFHDAMQIMRSIPPKRHRIAGKLIVY